MTPSPRCTKCGVEKTPVDFYADKSKARGHHSICKVCVKADRRSRYAEDPAKYNKRAKAYYEGHKEQFFEYARRNRREAIAAYGGKCVCCGETEPVFLAFDHINDDGAAHRKEIGEGATVIVQWVKKNGYPQDRIQLLCHCNWAKHHGGCPHALVPA